ncbi:Panacea domain-containing protein [Virgibacillus salexigens]|uniref:Panacea domain-containing protein n=1 Tax=Virgibacillus salexigens TaxID=61016 RepID=UPI00190C19C7|nr:type II toxin-antitoxin system antitoxin SocA domain-containing protein [Virgibacillus salexigens]
MTKAIDVAKFLVYIASKDPDVNDLSNLKLQKLLYYCQAASIQTNNKILFEDEIEAWQFGPVIKNVYKTFNGFGSMPIDTDYSDFIKNVKFDQSEIKAIAMAWKQYSQYSAGKLVELTHSELPWISAWRKQSNITENDMFKTFSNN